MPTDKRGTCSIAGWIWPSNAMPGATDAREALTSAVIVPDKPSMGYKDFLDRLGAGVSPEEIVRDIYAKINQDTGLNAWISTFAPHEVARRIRVARDTCTESPLSGVPFGVKDNIDTAGLPTTAACPSFAYSPKLSAEVVLRLEAAGAVPVGKTNMDQFATGLNGTRSPYGVCRNAFVPEFISGGSSSGSAVSVARGHAAFALGTDTAGSGRVPAAFNGLVGLKPTLGAWSTTGLVPACRSLDCITVFSKTVACAAEVWKTVTGHGGADPFFRSWKAPARAMRWDSPRLAVPETLEFFGDGPSEALFSAAVEKWKVLGAEIVRIPYTIFAEAASLLYGGPWVAERYAAVGRFLESNPPDADPTVKAIIMQGKKPSALNAFEAMYRLQELRANAARLMEPIDAMLVPTAPAVYRIADLIANPIELNTRLGTYTNFVNLLDLCAIAIPAGKWPQGVPYGITLVTGAFGDKGLLNLAARFLSQPAPFASDPDLVLVAVAGAHLSGLPLNHELTMRGARLVQIARTRPDYRLFALPSSAPPKPGLVRTADGSGGSIEVEVWEMPKPRFGDFVAAIPAPLGIGTLQLDDGNTVKGFLCESAALGGATDITNYGGWRPYLRSAGIASSEPAARGS